MREWITPGPRVTYDARADALYINVRRNTRHVVRTQEVRQDVFVEQDSQGRMIGAEVLNVSLGYKLPDTRNGRRIGRLISTGTVSPHIKQLREPWR